MACCTNQLEKSFSGVDETTVAIPATWEKPFVDVLYYDESLNKWFPAGWSTEITINPGVSVTVKHGGPATGKIKIQGPE